MALCGFNEKMIQGTILFLEGLEQQTQKRAIEESKSIAEFIETIELPELAVSIRTLSGKNKDDVFLGLSLIAQDFFVVMNGAIKDGKDFFDESKRYRENKIASLLESERKFYKELRPKYGFEKGIQILFKA